MNRTLVPLAACAVFLRPAVPVHVPLPGALSTPLSTARASAGTGAPKKLPPPLPPLGLLPSIARVRLEALPTGVLVVEDVNLPKGEYARGPLEFYVAFGVPGPPVAIDAHLIQVPDGAVEVPDSASGEALSTTRAPRRPNAAYPLLGRETMAGVVVHIPASSFTRAWAPGNMATLRVRNVVAWGDADVDGARDLVVRLGASRGAPLTLGRIVVTHRPGAPQVDRVDARLCGPEAEERPLAVKIAGRPRSASGDAEAPIAPVLAVRHASDDLCLRVWTSPSPR